MKSRHRVKTYGEVFTPRHMVEKVLDLVSEDLEAGPGFVDKTFLEPAAGDGNFLVAILRRKLSAIENRYPAEQWPTESLFALASIYGIEFLEDNHERARDAMLLEFVRFHEKHDVPCGLNTNLRRAGAFLIEANIVCGDTLTGLDSQGKDIQFSWWNRIPGSRGIVQREPFTFDSLRTGASKLTVYKGYRPCQINKIHVDGK